MALAELLREARLLKEYSLSHSGGRYTFPFGGYYDSHPGIHAQMTRSDPQFSFHTREAEIIFEIAKRRMIEYPEKPLSDVLEMAMAEAGVTWEDLTAEDVQVLDIALNWAQNGPPPPTQRVGGLPYGTGRGGAGHSLRHGTQPTTAPR